MDGAESVPAARTAAVVGGGPGSRSTETRKALLSAARAVFGSVGFGDAAILDVVTRAGASVGSLYHHFGGKADLYLALYEDFAERQVGWRPRP